MNIQKEKVMNAIGCGPHGLYAAKDCDPIRKQSECEAAYQQLYKAQEALSEAVAELHGRLGPALVGQNSNDCAAPSQAAQSEIHGWLIASEERTCAVTRRIRSIIESLTI